MGGALLNMMGMSMDTGAMEGKTNRESFCRCMVALVSSSTPIIRVMLQPVYRSDVIENDLNPVSLIDISASTCICAALSECCFDG